VFYLAGEAHTGACQYLDFGDSTFLFAWAVCPKHHALGHIPPLFRLRVQQSLLTCLPRAPYQVRMMLTPRLDDRGKRFGQDEKSLRQLVDIRGDRVALGIASLLEVKSP